MLGVPFGSGGERVARLKESVAILKKLLNGDHVTHQSRFYAMTDAAVSPLPVQKPRLPILIAGSGRQLLSLAAREADIVAIGFPPDATESDASERVGWIRSAAGPRFSELELNMNLMAVGEHVPRWIAATMRVTARDLAERGSIAAVSGDAEQMCEQLRDRRARLGISYVLVADELMDAFAPVVERLAGK
jgi:alkanesulfonate monooxygenase SsuD/methylene tetrahydromethanopterin reductase-like flavin-dependent oxidoreductase (luciferase family)